MVGCGLVGVGVFWCGWLVGVRVGGCVRGCGLVGVGLCGWGECWCVLVGVCGVVSDAHVLWLLSVFFVLLSWFCLLFG